MVFAEKKTPKKHKNKPKNSIYTGVIFSVFYLVCMGDAGKATSPNRLTAAEGHDTDWIGKRVSTRAKSGVLHYCVFLHGWNEP